MTGSDARERRALAGAYALYFGGSGVILPFLPAHFAALGVPPSRIGLLLALGPAVALFAPARWGRRADRSGRPDRALRAVTLGAALCFAALLPARSFWPALLAMGGYAVFSTSITPLLDALTIECVRRAGGSFGRIRLAGSLAFAVSAALFGRFGGSGLAAVVVPLVALAGLAAWTTFCLPPPGAVGGPKAWPARPGPSPARPAAAARPAAGATPVRPDARPALAGVAPWREPLAAALAPFLVACLLHWMALAPFHGSFALHVAALGLSPRVTGACSALGVLAEVAVMAGSATLLRRWGAIRVLRLSFAAGVVRWGLMAVVQGAPALLAVSLLHGLTFGAFYVAAVAFVSERVPSARRASGQAIFAAATFGIGGIAGYALSGVGFQALGGPGLFAAASVVELAALGFALTLRPPAAGPAAPAR